ncbi:hypothetical protein K439DRAFT_1512405, partial [Ramaria rubella]
EPLSSTHDNRRLEYIHLTNEATPVTHTQLTRSVSILIAQNRARNNISNRNEFLHKRRHVQLASDAPAAEGSSSMQVDLPTCARTDPLPVNRDVQMKYDVAKNEGGPLKRTVKPEPSNTDLEHSTAGREGKGKGKDNTFCDDIKPTLQRHPGLSERFANLEEHLAVRYVPLPPVSLLDRLRFLEDHILRLERDYPPWAALHFQQPNRGWPPPPRSTPIIVPSHLTSTIESSGEDPAKNRDSSQSKFISGVRGTTRSRGRAKSSSLHRSVMQKLEVKKALAGED